MADDKRTQKPFSSEEKALAVKRHLEAGEAVSAICEDLGIVPDVFDQWQKELSDRGAAASEVEGRGKPPDGSFRKSPKKRRWIFLVAFVLFTLVALIGADYGAFLIYMVPAMLCILQYFYPRILVWGILFVIFLLGSVMYSCLLIADIYRLVVGVRPWTLVDVNDSVVFILLSAIVVGITFVVFVSRPRLTPVKEETGQE